MCVLKRQFSFVYIYEKNAQSRSETRRKEKPKYTNDDEYKAAASIWKQC